MKIPSLVDLTCKEVVELVTEYMSDDMSAEDCARFEQHLHACTWCMTYLAQMRRTVEWTAQLAQVAPTVAANDIEAASPSSPTSPSPAAQEKVLNDVFRRWKQNKP